MQEGQIINDLIARQHCGLVPAQVIIVPQPLRSG